MLLLGCRQQQFPIISILFFGCNSVNNNRRGLPFSPNTELLALSRHGKIFKILRGFSIYLQEFNIFFFFLSRLTILIILSWTAGYYYPRKMFVIYASIVKVMNDDADTEMLIISSVETVVYETSIIQTFIKIEIERERLGKMFVYN